MGSSLPFFYSLLLFVRFAFRFIVIIIITIFGARCAVVCLRWCEEFYWVALAWICGLTFYTGLTKFTLYSYDYGHDHSIRSYLVLACMYVGAVLFVAAFGAFGAVQSFRSCRGCPKLSGLSGLSGACGAVGAVRGFRGC